MPKTHIVIVTSGYLYLLLSLNKKDKRNFAKKPKSWMKPPAINSSRKKPELILILFSKPRILKPVKY